MRSAFASYGATFVIRPMGPMFQQTETARRAFRNHWFYGSNHQQRRYRLGSFGSLAPPAPFRLDIRRMCPRLAILGSAGIRRSDEWTAGEGRTVAESNLW